MALPGQYWVAKIYNSDHIQILVAVLIGFNFLTNIIEKEIDPHGDKYADTFEGFGLFYNICFTVELLVNLYAHWFKHFFRSGWNVFDCIVVMIGVVNTVKLPLPPAFSLLRMMRAFRVFRLFKRVHSLNKIIVAIVHAVPGVLNAFLILAIVMSIYAILAVEFYYEIGENCLQPGSPDAWLLTPRGYCSGEEYFGTFSKSLYTFFQVLTGESWSEMVARPAMWAFFDEPLKIIAGGFFFVSYFLITAFVLTNVVVAVLLDKMVDPEVAEAAAEMAAEEDEEDEDEGDEAIEDATPVPKGDEANNNGEDPPPPAEKAEITPEDITRTMASVTSQVDQLVNASEKMSSELDSFRGEMTTMKQQVAGVIDLLPMMKKM